MAKEYFVKEEDIDVLKDNVDNKISSPNTAEVGQILSVKAIDGNGKPTEWEVIDKPGSGPGESSPYIYMTQEEYEALTEYEQDKMYWVTYPFTGCYLVWKNGVAIMGEGCQELPYSDEHRYICSGRNVVINFNPVMKGFYYVYSGNNTNNRTSRVKKLETTKNVTNLPSNMFYGINGIYGIEEIKLSNSITSIDSYAFKGETKLLTIIINKPQDSISGAPWGATNATVVWTG